MKCFENVFIEILKVKQYNGDKFDIIKNLLCSTNTIFKVFEILENFNNQEGKIIFKSKIF